MSIDNPQVGELDHYALENLHDRYDGQLEKADPDEVADVLEMPEYADFYEDLAQNDPDLWRAVTSNLEQEAMRTVDGVEQVAMDGGVEEDIESGGNALYDGVKALVDSHPVAAKLGAAASVVGALGVGYAATNSGGSGGPGDGGFNGPATPDTPTPDGVYSPTPDSGSEESIGQTSSQETREPFTLADVNRTLSASNMTEEVLMQSYLSENVSDEHVGEVYSVFDGELDNGTELAEMVTNEDGEIRQKYIKEEYRTNGSATEIERGTNLTEIVDREQIVSDIENESQNTTSLQHDIAGVEEWYEGEYEEQLATEIAEDSLNASASNVSVNSSSEGNFTVNGTFQTEDGEFQDRVNVSYDEIRDSKQNFTTVLETLDTVRSINQTQEGNQTAEMTDRFFQELDEGNFESIQDARMIGEAYENESVNSSANVTEEAVLEGYLQNETTDRELDYLTQVHEQNSTDLVNATADPLSDDWTDSGVDNLALMDLGMDPLEDHELLSDYQINRTDTGESAANNTYRIVEVGDGSGFNSTVDSGQLSRFAPALESVNEEFQNPSEADNAELFYDDITRQEQMTAVTDFAFKYMDNESHTDTVVDMANLAVIDERDTDEWGPGMAERITYFNTFDEAWESQDEAFQFARLMVDEESLEYADEAGLQLNDPIFSQAMEDGYFSHDHDERLDEERLENLEEETVSYGDELEEPDVEPDEVDRLEDDDGGSHSSSSSSDSSSDSGNDGSDSGGDDPEPPEPPTGGPGGNPGGDDGDDGDDGKDDDKSF